MRIETLAVHAGHAVDPATGAVTPPIHLTTTFGREADGSLPHGFLYARSDNPTRRELEQGLAPELWITIGLCLLGGYFLAIGLLPQPDRSE